eukprot:487042-Pleurochrysis_carterae.AAC.1
MASCSSRLPSLQLRLPDRGTRIRRSSRARPRYVSPLRQLRRPLSLASPCLTLLPRCLPLKRRLSPTSHAG